MSAFIIPKFTMPKEPGKRSQKAIDGITPLIQTVMDAILEAVKEQPGIKGASLRNVIERRVGVSRCTIDKAKGFLKDQTAIVYVNTIEGCGYYLTAEAPSDECQPMIRVMSKAAEMKAPVSMPKCANAIEWSLRMLGGAA